MYFTTLKKIFFFPFLYFFYPFENFYMKLYTPHVPYFGTRKRYTVKNFHFQKIDKKKAKSEKKE